MPCKHRIRRLSNFALATLLLACSMPVFATGTGPAMPEAGTSASDRLAFRVVIRERLDASSGLRASTPASRRIQTQRRVDTVDNRPVLTIASP